MVRKTGIEDKYIEKDGKRLRYGYTTGTCAAAAAAAAAEYLLTGRCPECVEVTVPEGTRLLLEPVSCGLREASALCGIVKDAGDDPDVTDGVTVFAEVERADAGIEICGGTGVGTVTRKGLEQPVGSPAINRMPRQMIGEALGDAAKKAGYGGGFRVTVSVPGGEKIAQKTFNPDLGIEGGISILGTSGLVRPMSEDALLETISIRIRQKLAEGNGSLVITPGNYGREFLHSLGAADPVLCSNFVGETFDRAVSEGAEEVFFVSHIGKAIKVAGGIMNTHSAVADCRAELMAACALEAGAGRETSRRILETVTTDEALEILERAGLRDGTMDAAVKRIERHLTRRTAGRLKIHAIVFSNLHGMLGQTPGAVETLRERISDEG